MNTYTLTADGGSTKTAWLLQCDGKNAARITTQGINPFMLGQADIEHILRTQILCDPRFLSVHSIRYFGAGCCGTGCAIVEAALRAVWPMADGVVVGSDLIGAATALCGDADGIACILGTGSNSGLYIKGKIEANTPPLGYILGDEGSGAALGRRLIGDLFKQQLPPQLSEAFSLQYGLSLQAVIERVYKQPLANRFLASFAPFLSAHRDEQAIHDLLVSEFSAFFKRNIANYRRPDLPVSFVGSIAFYFQDELLEAATACGYKLGRIMRSPLEEV